MNEQDGTLGMIEEKNDFIQYLLDTGQLTTHPSDEAHHCGGDISVFSARLQHIFEEYKNDCTCDANKLCKLEAQKGGKEKELTLEEASLAEMEADAKKIEEELPSLNTKKPTFLQKVGVVMYPFFLLFLSIYLYIFYSSAIYSAIFRVIDLSNAALLNSIFYPKAFSEAWAIGDAALGFVLVAPFVFMAFGVILHKSSEQPTFLSKAAYTVPVVIISFLLDYLIAFEICKKIYDANVANSFREMPPYNFSMAFDDVNFWVIIFLGFIVYIVWGVLLKINVAHFKSIEKPKAFLDKEAVWKQKLEDIKEKNLEIGAIEKAINALSIRIERHRKTTLFDWDKIEHIMRDFTAEWVSGVTKIKGKEIKGKRPETSIYAPKAEEIFKKFKLSNPTTTDEKE